MACSTENKAAQLAPICEEIAAGGMAKHQRKQLRGERRGEAPSAKHHRLGGEIMALAGESGGHRG